MSKTDAELVAKLVEIQRKIDSEPDAESKAMMHMRLLNVEEYAKLWDEAEALAAAGVPLSEEVLHFFGIDQQTLN